MDPVLIIPLLIIVVALIVVLRTVRIVPQQTAQMSWPTAGHARFAFR